MNDIDCISYGLNNRLDTLLRENERLQTRVRYQHEEILKLQRDLEIAHAMLSVQMLEKATSGQR